ncbi:hypothetical protein IJ135_01965, partial [Candidatus Saccharibacteria bacterium]|nr:hypothetical protein [Candidatus Saccharibacteria bacterium]
TGSNSYTDGETVWYNYAAATAMTITGNSNSTTAVYDLCPKNWHLPSYNTSPGAIYGINRSAFSPIGGGYYCNGTNAEPNTGTLWWSNTSSSSVGRYYIIYNPSANYFDTTNGTFSGCDRADGRYIRCVRTS